MLTILVFILSAIPSIHAACYTIAGHLMTDSEDSNLQSRVPCYPFAKISHCCSSIDYCLSNGLCLDAGGDGLFTIQGCTDANWPAPCHGIFNSCSQEGDYVPLWMCRSGPRVASWCCGNRNEARCCVDALVENKSLVEIPSPDAAFHPHALTGTADAGDDKSSDGSGPVDKLGVGAAIAIGVLGLVLAYLQLRRMVRDSQTRGEPLSYGTVISRRLRIWKLTLQRLFSRPVARENDFPLLNIRRRVATESAPLVTGDLADEQVLLDEEVDNIE